MGVQELRAELRALRKDTVKPISKMGARDVSAEIQRLKVLREETPAVRAVPSGAPMPRGTTESIAVAKAEEFPVQTKKTPKTPKAKVEKELIAPNKGEAPPAPKGRKVKMVDEMEAKETKSAPKKAKSAPAPAPPAKKGRPAKGSEEARARMAELRARKGKKA